MGVAGIMVVVAAIGPAPGPDGLATGDLERPVETVVLAIPEGMVGKSLVITDEAGRDLATLTRWFNGETAAVMRGEDGPHVGCYMNHKGGVNVAMIGTDRRTRIEMERDGMTWTSATPNPHRRNRESPARGSAPE